MHEVKTKLVIWSLSCRYVTSHTAIGIEYYMYVISYIRTVKHSRFCLVAEYFQLCPDGPKIVPDGPDKPGGPDGGRPDGGGPDGGRPDGGRPDGGGPDGGGPDGGGPDGGGPDGGRPDGGPDNGNGGKSQTQKV